MPSYSIGSLMGAVSGVKDVVGDCRLQIEIPEHAWGAMLPALEAIHAVLGLDSPTADLGARLVCDGVDIHVVKGFL